MAAKQAPRDFTGEAASLVGAAAAGTLATVASGLPHAALVTPAWGPDGAPLLLLSSLAVHTRHLTTHPFCALLIIGPSTGDNPQTTPRLCLSGQAAVTTDPAARASYLARHPYAGQYVDFADFAFWRLDITQALYIGGFAAAAALDPERLRQTILRGQAG